MDNEIVERIKKTNAKFLPKNLAEYEAAYVTVTQLAWAADLGLSVSFQDINRGDHRYDAQWGQPDSMVPIVSAAQISKQPLMLTYKTIATDDRNPNWKIVSVHMLVFMT